MDALYVIPKSRIDWPFGLCWVFRLAALSLIPCTHEVWHTITKHVIPHNTNGRMNSFQMLKNRMEIQLFRADSISDYSTQYCFNRLHMNMVRYLENRADHPNNGGFSWVGPNTIDSSWQISSPSCLRNFTQWRQIWMLQWLHVLDWPVQFTWPRIWQASPSWVTVNVRWICPMWEY